MSFDESKNVVNTPTDEAGFAAMIAAEEEKISELYAAIGKKYFEIHSDSAEPELQELISQIKDARGRIDGYNVQIDALNGLVRCPKCGNKVSDSSFFCSFCGMVFNKSNSCINCGASVENGEVFCANCKRAAKIGTDEAVEEQEPTIRIEETPVEAVEEAPAQIAEEPANRINEEPVNFKEAPVMTEPSVVISAPRCTNCGTPLNDGDIFCTECGTRAVQPASVEETTFTSIKRCTNCGTAINDGDAFCTECGTRVAPPSFNPPSQEASAFCMNCGERLESDSLFCFNCGKRV